MKKVLVGLVFVTVSLFATGVSQMKILGIGLGDKYEDIKKKLPCDKKYNVEENCYDGDKSYTLDTKSFRIICDNETNSKKETLYATFDNQEKLYDLSREITFKINPEWESIKADLIKAYGQPNSKNIGEYYDGISNGKRVYDNKTSYCYGDECELSSSGLYSTTKGLIINIIQNNIGFNGLYFTIYDRSKRTQNDSENKTLCEKQMKQQKQKASKINF